MAHSQAHWPKQQQSRLLKGVGRIRSIFCKFLKILFQWVLYYVTPIITNFFWKGGLSNTQELSRVV